MKKILLGLLLISSTFAYTLQNGATGPTQGTVTFPSSTELTYQHDGSEIGSAMVLDSFQIHATDAANNVGPDAWIYVKITPVDNQAPVISSDTITVPEGGSINYSPSVTDVDTP